MDNYRGLQSKDIRLNCTHDRVVKETRKPRATSEFARFRSLINAKHQHKDNKEEKEKEDKEKENKEKRSNKDSEKRRKNIIFTENNCFAKAVAEYKEAQRLQSTIKFKSGHVIEEAEVEESLEMNHCPKRVRPDKPPLQPLYQ